MDKKRLCTMTMMMSSLDLAVGEISTVDQQRRECAGPSLPLNCWFQLCQFVVRWTPRPDARLDTLWIELGAVHGGRLERPRTGDQSVLWEITGVSWVGWLVYRRCCRVRDCGLACSVCCSVLFKRGGLKGRLTEGLSVSLEGVVLVFLVSLIVNAYGFVAV